VAKSRPTVFVCGIDVYTLKEKVLPKNIFSHLGASVVCYVCVVCFVCVVYFA
jgi:hypothetical protein